MNLSNHWNGFQEPRPNRRMGRAAIEHARTAGSSTKKWVKNTSKPLERTFTSNPLEKRKGPGKGPPSGGRGR